MGEKLIYLWKACFESYFFFSSFSVEEILANTLPRSKPISIIGGTNGSTNRTNDTTSRPISRIIEGSIWQPDEETPSVQIQPPSPMHKERPQSALVEPPHLPAKKRLGGATSELQMHQASLGVKQPAAARLYLKPPTDSPPRSYFRQGLTPTWRSSPLCLPR